MAEHAAGRNDRELVESVRRVEAKLAALQGELPDARALARIEDKCQTLYLEVRGLADRVSRSGDLGASEHVKRLAEAEKYLLEASHAVRRSHEASERLGGESSSMHTKVEAVKAATERIENKLAPVVGVYASIIAIVSALTYSGYKLTVLPATVDAASKAIQASNQTVLQAGSDLKVEISSLELVQQTVRGSTDSLAASRDELDRVRDSIGVEVSNLVSKTNELTARIDHNVTSLGDLTQKLAESQSEINATSSSLSKALTVVGSLTTNLEASSAITAALLIKLDRGSGQIMAASSSLGPLIAQVQEKLQRLEQRSGSFQQQPLTEAPPVDGNREESPAAVLAKLQRMAEALGAPTPPAERAYVEALTQLEAGNYAACRSLAEDAKTRGLVSENTHFDLLIAQSYYVEARTQLEAGNYAACRSLAEDAKTRGLVSEITNFDLLIAQSYHLQGNHQQAVEHWTLAVEVEPLNDAALHNLGISLGDLGLESQDAAQRAALQEQSIAAFRRALAIDGSDIVTLIALVNAYEAAGRIDEALALALSAEEDSGGQLAFALSKLYAAKGDLSKLLEALGRASAAAPQYALAAAADDRFRDARGNEEFRSILLEALGPSIFAAVELAWATAEDPVDEGD